MVQRIADDHRRFKAILRGRVRENLNKHITSHDLVAQSGSKKIRVPVHQLDIPRFIFDPRDAGGVGQGPGEPGDGVGGAGKGSGAGQPGEGSGAGSEGTVHSYEEFTPEELAELLGEHLELPRIEPRGGDELESAKTRYTGIQTVGPESLRDFKRTFKEALKREIGSGTYKPGVPVVPRRGDKRYRSNKPRPVPENNALIVYMMDVSGSMGEAQKRVARHICWWADLWISSQYEGTTKSRYIIHDADAQIVDRATFFNTNASGGTRISSAYRCFETLIKTEFPPDNWNIYLFQYSDGDNLSTEDNALCSQLIEDMILPAVNLFCFGQVRSTYGSGRFLPEVVRRYREDERVEALEINSLDAVPETLRRFLGTGR